MNGGGTVTARVPINVTTQAKHVKQAARLEQGLKQAPCESIHVRVARTAKAIMSNEGNPPNMKEYKHSGKNKTTYPE